MIREISIVNSLNERLDCELACPEKSGFAITKLDGLGPNDIDLKTTQIASGSGYFINKKMNKYREIKLTIQYYEDNNERLSVEDLRRKCYKYLQRGEEVDFYVATDTNTYAIQGCVSKNEETIFSNACGAVITVMCPMPYFYAKGFEHRKKITKELYQASEYPHVFTNVYEGDGFSYPEVVFHFDETSTGTYKNGLIFKISNSDGEKGVEIQTPISLGISDDDDIKITFDPKSFKILLIHSGTETDITEYCDFLDKTSRTGLPAFIKGKNVVKIDRIVQGTESERIYVTIAYPIFYAGV